MVDLYHIGPPIEQPNRFERLVHLVVDAIDAATPGAYNEVEIP